MSPPHPRPVLAAALKRIPRCALPGDFQPVFGGKWQESECGICLENFQASETVCTLPCGHYLHDSCTYTTFTALRPLRHACRAAIFDEDTTRAVEDERRQSRDNNCLRLHTRYENHIKASKAALRRAGEVQNNSTARATAATNTSARAHFLDMWDQVDTARRNIEEETRPWAEAIFDGDDYAESAPFVLHLERFCREIIAGYRNETTEWSPLDHDYFFTLCIIALAHGSAYPEIRIPATWLLPDGSMISRPKNSATTIY